MTAKTVRDVLDNFNRRRRDHAKDQAIASLQLARDDLYRYRATLSGFGAEGVAVMIDQVSDFLDAMREGE